jgi:Protein of unknown function (DUF1499)
MKDALDRGLGPGKRLARIGGWSAAIGAALVAVSGIGAKLGMLAPFASMGAYSLGSLALLIAFITAAISVVRAGAGETRGPTWLALVAGLALTGVNGNLFRDMGSPYHDISTDAGNPPAFVAVAGLRTARDNPVEYTGPATPPAGVEPLLTSASPAAVFAAATAVIGERGWPVAASSETDGRIEATAETRWVRFKDDVVLRVSSDGSQTRLDIRSKSRVGRGDMGANAARVRQLMTDIKARLGS